MNLKELFHYTIPDREPTRQQRLARMLLLFAALMLLLTLISRAADSLTIARVETESPKSGPIEHRLSRDGVLSANLETPVLAFEGALVENVGVYEGAAVQSGDVLFTFALSDLQSQLEEKKIGLKKLQLDLQSYYQQDQSGAERDTLSLSRAEEDYDFGLEAAQEDVRRANRDKRDASDDLDALRDEYEDEFDDEWRDITIGHSGWDQKKGLMDAYEAKRRAYEDAVRKQEETLRSAERALEDAGRTDPPGVAIQQKQLDIQLAQMGIERLQAVLDAEGKVRSEVDGIVAALNVGTGKRSPSEAAAVIAVASEGFRFKASFDSEEAKYVARGDKAELTLVGKTRAAETKIESLVPSSAKPGGVDATVLVKDGEIGQAATLNITKRSENYGSRIPISALRGVSGSYYVLVVSEIESVLGMQKIAEKIPVTVLDQNDAFVAVQGALQNSSKIITDSSKNIFEGDRVRILDQ